MLPCTETGRANIERFVWFIGLYLLEMVIVATPNKDEGIAEAFLYWTSESSHCAPEGTK
jgi:hypothetical protein